MRIAIDVTEAAGGTLLRALERADRRHEFVGLVPVRPTRTPLGRWWWEQVGLPTAARRAGAEVLHQPAGSPPRFRGWRGVGRVDDPRDRRRTRFIPFAAQTVVRSEAAKDVLASRATYLPARVRVVYAATDAGAAHVRAPELARRTRERYGLGERYLLSPDPAAIHDADFLLRVFVGVRTKVRRPVTLALRVDGARALGPLLERIRDLGLAHVVRLLPAVPDRDWPLILAGAAAAVFPRRDDLVASAPLAVLAYGLPTVAAAAGAIPELVGPAAILVPPDDAAAWTKALAGLMADAALRRDYAGRAAKQARRFSWERAARETVRVYERALRDRRP